MSLFNLSDLKSREPDFQSSALGVNGSAAPIFVRNQDLLDSIFPGLPATKDIHFVTKGDWSTHDLVFHLLKFTGPSQLYFTTYSLREYPVRLILNALDAGMLTSVKCILDSKVKSRLPDVFHLAAHNFADVKLTECHAKITVIKNLEHSITIMGSANWTNNPRIEAGFVSMDKSLADFHIDWMEKCMINSNAFE